MTSNAHVEDGILSDFNATREQFFIPEGVIYLNGNSLGPMPRGTEAALSDFLHNEWGTELIRGWNTKDWFNQSNTLGNRLARLIGAEPDTVVVGDTLSIKVFQAVASALAMRPERRIILSDSGNFPTDLYMAEGLIKLKDKGIELRTPDPEAVEEHITEDVAVVMVTEVDYRTGRIHNMKRLIEKAHGVGAVVVWDLAHSAGAIPVDLAGCNADFAVGCTYKYLNAGPGGPAFIYVAPRHIDTVEPALSGWHGHAAPFAFDLGYRPAGNIEKMRIGTPPVAAFKILSVSLDIWDQVSMQDVRDASIDLSETFIREVEARCTQLQLASPRDPLQRGSQVSFAFEHGYACMQALIDRGVIGDFRAPDIMRFGFTPLFIGKSDVLAAVDILEDIMTSETWRNEKFHRKSLVT